MHAHINFSTTHSTSDKTFFIPASGYRMYFNSQLYDVSSNGNYWSAAPDNATHGYSLGIYSTVVYLPYNGYRAGGFSMRPVQE